MQRSDWFAVLVGIFILGAGAYLSTFPTEVIRKSGLALMAAAVIGLAIWFVRGYGEQRMSTWGPWVLIFGGPILGLLWLYASHLEPSATPVDKWTWTPLTSQEIDNLYVALHGKGQYSIHIACSRAECDALAKSFDQLFKRLGWPSVVGEGGVLAIGVTGLMVNPEDDAARLLKSSIETNSRLRVELSSIPRKVGDVNPTMLVIGTKPAEMPTGPLLSPSPAASSFSITFPDEANDPETGYPVSPYGSIVNLGVAGDLMSKFISKHMFFFKITNDRKLTAKDIDVFAIAISYKRGTSTNIKVLLPRLPPEESSKTLHPGDGAFFKLLEYLDEKPNGLLVEHVDADKMQTLRLISRRGWLTPLPYGAAAFAIPTLGGVGIQKPVKADNAIYVDIAIYAADLPPTFGRFLIEGPEPATVHLIAQGDALPKLDLGAP